MSVVDPVLLVAFTSTTSKLVYCPVKLGCKDATEELWLPVELLLKSPEKTPVDTGRCMSKR